MPYKFIKTTLYYKCILNNLEKPPTVTLTRRDRAITLQKAPNPKTIKIDKVFILATTNDPKMLTLDNKRWVVKVQNLTILLSNTLK